ncbi:MAG: methyltransferase domain-containing protein [Parvularculaceae bacterium]
MQTDVLEFRNFYHRPIGTVTRRFIAARLTNLWGAAPGLSVVGYGYAGPYLDRFREAAARVVNLAPESQGTTRWPNGGPNQAALVEEARWPLPDACADRIIIAHGLEEAESAPALLREAWRVLADDGRLVIVATNRASSWALSDSTPFGAGRPFSRQQLQQLLEDALFTPEAWSGALYFPPTNWSLVLRSARAFERIGAALWRPFAGALLVEATKSLVIAAPAAGSRRRRRRAIAGAASRLSPRAEQTRHPRNFGDCDGADI